ncbi:hypothetical protein T439DRAFT_359446 [Meredithblackwellia eburnea MCA 4105]
MSGSATLLALESRTAPRRLPAPSKEVEKPIKKELDKFKQGSSYHKSFARFKRTLHDYLKGKPGYPYENQQQLDTYIGREERNQNLASRRREQNETAEQEFQSEPNLQKLETKFGELTPGQKKYLIEEVIMERLASQDLSRFNHRALPRKQKECNDLGGRSASVTFGPDDHLKGNPFYNLYKFVFLHLDRAEKINAESSKRTSHEPSPPRNEEPQGTFSQEPEATRHVGDPTPPAVDLQPTPTFSPHTNHHHPQEPIPAPVHNSNHQASPAFSQAHQGLPSIQEVLADLPNHAVAS